MADIVLLNPNQYIKSANTTDYVASSTVLINPNVSAVENVPVKYWKKGTGNTVVEMNASEKLAISEAELSARKNGADTFNAGMIEIFTALIKVINIRLPVNQKITKQELIDAVKAEVI